MLPFSHGKYITQKKKIVLLGQHSDMAKVAPPLKYNYVVFNPNMIRVKGLSEE